MLHAESSLPQASIANKHIINFAAGKATTVNQQPQPYTRKSGRLRKRVISIVHNATAKVATAVSASTVPTASSSASVPTHDATPIANNINSKLPRFQLRSVVPHYKMHLSPDRADTNDPTGNKCDAAIFMRRVKLEKGRQNWAYQLLPAEFKVGKTENDPFEDHQDRDTRPLAQDRLKVLGQLTAYADRVFAYQHRTAVYMLFVIGSEFRFLRWDRSGVFVTQKVDYVEHTATLVEFLLGFLVLDEASQGLDITATLLDPKSDEYKSMDNIAQYGGPKDSATVLCLHQDGTMLPSSVPLESVSDTSSGAASAEPTSAQPTSSVRPQEGTYMFEYIREYFEDSLKEKWPRYRLAVGDQSFLVGRPIFDSPGLIGRGTRGFVAWHEQASRFVFMKDAWRPFYENMDTEGETLKKLNDAGVMNVPTLICHGHVEDQETLASNYCVFVDGRSNAERKAAAYDAKDRKGKTKRKADDVEHEDHRRDDERKPRLRHYAHYRVVVKEICLPLTSFTTSKQLVSIIRDCIDGAFDIPSCCSCRLMLITAHCFAVEKCKIIHRDISGGNILIFPTLVQKPGTRSFYVSWQDWELSKPTMDCEGGRVARQPERTVSSYLPCTRTTSLTNTFREPGAICLLRPLRTPRTSSPLRTRSRRSSTFSCITPFATCATASNGG